MGSLDFVCGFYSITSLSTSLESEAKSSLSSAVSEKKNYIDLAFKDQMDLATSISNESEVVDYFNTFAKTNQPNKQILDRISTNLESKFKNSDGLCENMIFQILDSEKNKVTVADSLGGSSLGDKRPPNQQALNNLQKAGKAIMGSIMASPVTGRPVITISSPVIDNSTKQLTAISLTSVDLNTLSQNIVKSNSNSSIKTLLINSAGVVVSSEDSSQILKFDLSKEDGDLLDFYNTLKSNASGISYFTINGVKSIASYDKSNITNEIQEVTKIVVSSVENLKNNSENVLDFIDSTVIADYIAMVNTGEQYY